MPNKRVPIFERAMNLLKVSFFMSKMKKPIALKLTLLKKTRVLKKLKNHNYGFIREYEFSPSNTPLVHYNRKLFKKRSNRSDIYSMLFLCRCSSKLRMEWEREDDDDDWALETPPIMDDIVISDVKPHELSYLDESEEEDDSIDRKAEMFIQRFYEQMKMQSQESLLQYK